MEEYITKAFRVIILLFLANCRNSINRSRNRLDILNHKRYIYI